MVPLPNNNFMMDFENSLLEGWLGPIPTGPLRYKHPEWGDLVRANVAPHHSDVTFTDYMYWCELGGGDEWFQPPEPELTPEDMRRCIRQAGG